MERHEKQFYEKSTLELAELLPGKRVLRSRILSRKCSTSLPGDDWQLDKSGHFKKQGASLAKIHTQQPPYFSRKGYTNVKKRELHIGKFKKITLFESESLCVRKLP